MSTLYPAAQDDGTTLPNPTGSNNQSSPDHASLHANANDAIKAVQAKVGTGASTPSNNTFLVGNGSGTSVWSSLTSAQVAARVSDETGSGSLVFANTPTLTTPKANTINEETAANGVTIDGLNIKDGKLNTNDSVVTANITDDAVTYAKVATGFCVQVVDALYSAVATGTTLLPYDDTIPQNTEGDQYMTVSITPKATTNKLVIEAVCHLANSAASQRFTTALFQDSTANALAVGNTTEVTANCVNAVSLYHSMTAGTTSSTAFKIRAGCNAAGTTTFNGDSGARKFGGLTFSFIRVMEFQV